MKRIFLAATLLICAMMAQAQSPDMFNYQAVARDAGGNVIPNTNVAVRLTIRHATSTGTILYRERHTILTNQFGLFTCQIGTGTQTTGTFATINWADSSKFLQVEFDPSGGLSYVDMGTSQLISVPYAKLADAVNMFPSGNNNADKMVITHSAAFPTWGLQYQDVGDKFIFTSGVNPVFTVDLLKRYVGIGTSSPSSQLHVTGSRASESDTGLATFTNTGTGNTIYASGMGTVLGDGAVIAADNKNAGTGVFGSTTGSGWAIYGYNPAGAAGHFAGNVEVTDYTELGTGAPAIKMKKLTGTTTFQANAAVQIPHGLDATKILAVNILVENAAGNYIPPNHLYTALSEYHYYVHPTYILIWNASGNSSNIYSKPIKILITYEE